MIAVNLGALGTSSRKLRIQPNSTLYTFAEVVKVDRPSRATNSRARRPPGRCDRTGSMHRPPHRRTHRGALLSVPKNHAPDLERAVLPRARRIASQPQRSQIKRREPTERLCSFVPLMPAPTFGFSLKAQRSHPPIAMRPGCTELHAIGACHAARDHCLVWRCAAATVSQRVRSPHARACEFDTIFAHTESRRTAACSPQDAQR